MQTYGRYCSRGLSSLRLRSSRRLLTLLVVLTAATTLSHGEEQTAGRGKQLTPTLTATPPMGWNPWNALAPMTPMPILIVGRTITVPCCMRLTWLDTTKSTGNNSAIATAARAHDLPSTIDLVCTSFRGPEGLRILEEECVQGKGLGFNGKQCIHPSQVDVAQRTFAPGEKEVEWAVRVVIGDAKADAGDRGAWTLEGKMIDVPVVGKAKATVRRAELCGIDVDAIREKWKDQEPQ